MTSGTKTIVRTFLKAIETNDQTNLTEVLARDLVFHVPGMPHPVDRERHIQGIGRLHMGFSDFQLTIENQIAEADMVAARLTWQATHTGAIWGLAPTGKQVTVTGVSIERIKDGKIVERRFNQDELGLMRQLGAVPPPQQGN